MGVLDLDIATVEWMRGASDEVVGVAVGMWLGEASACRLPCRHGLTNTGHGGLPDVVGSIPVEAEASTCMRRGGSLSEGQFAYVARGGVAVTPGGLGGKGSLRVFDSMVKIGCR